AGNFAKVALLQGSDRVDVRYLLSGSGRRLAVIPTKPLEVSTEYTVSVGDLRDAYDGAVQVSPSTFPTRDLVAPVFDIDAIEFLISDDGVITIKAAIGTLPLGGQVLVINETTGEVASFQIDNQGGLGILVPATIQGSIDDRLMISVTDTNGSVTTFERSQFVKADGTIAIGPGGGTIKGPGGVELRIPEGALEKGVTLQIEGL